MQITALVENHSHSPLQAKHGLALYIETQRHKLLFDLGPDRTLFDNASRKGIDLTQVDTVILSHGHLDHGGALARFLSLNTTAKIYAQKSAFEPHYSKLAFLKVPVGLKRRLAAHPQLILLDESFAIDDELTLFTVKEAGQCPSPANDSLYSADGRDDFCHEQHLLIREQKTALIMGCGHTGVLNILSQAACTPDLCVGGYHLYDLLTKKTVPASLLNAIALGLRSYPQTQFYTCHCTGQEAYQQLKSQLPALSYLACGDTITL